MSASRSDDLSITEDNRHQYLETSVATISDAHREIRNAEKRGRIRRERENERRKVIFRSAWIALAILVGVSVFFIAR